MRWTRAILFLLTLHPAGAAAQTLDVNHYYSLWQRQTAGCGDTEACCARQLHCMNQMWQTIGDDLEAGRPNSSFTAFGEREAVWRPFRSRVAAYLSAPHCPPQIRRVARDIQTGLSHSFDLRSTMGESSDDATESYNDMSYYVSSMPPEDASFLQCSVPVADLTFPPDPDAIDALVRRFEAAAREGAPVLAGLYRPEVAAQSLTNVQKARVALAEAALAEAAGGNPLPFYEAAADFARQEGAPVLLIRALPPLRDAAFRADDAEAALPILLDLAEAYSALNRVADAASAFTAAGRMAHVLRRPDQTDAHFADALRIAATLPDGVATANAMLEQLHFLLRNTDRYRHACALRQRIVDHLAEFGLSGDAALAEATGEVNCGWVHVWFSAQALIDRAFEQEAAGNISQGIELLTRALALAEQPGFETVDRAPLISSISGSRGWLAILALDLPTARRDTERALSLQPEEDWLAANLAFIDLLQGEETRGLAVLGDLIQREGEEAAAFRNVIAEDIASLRGAGYPQGQLDDVAALLEKTGYSDPQ